MAMDWRAEYVKATALEEEDTVSASACTSQRTSKTPVDKVLAFVDLLLKQEGGEWWAKFRRHRMRNSSTTKSDGQEVREEDKKQLRTLEKRLAAVGSELLVKLPELNASVGHKPPRSAKVRVLQLQLVCRMLHYGVLTKKKKEEKKQLKKEIRGLLDRVALLLDAANPPSLADEDADERSPFQEFLQQKLAPRLQILLPGLVQYLLKAYELEEGEKIKEHEDKDAGNAMLPTPVVKPAQPPTEPPTSSVAGKGSILSALRDERPAKRARPEASGLFKEVQLPHQLQQKQAQARPRKSKRGNSSTNKSSSANKARSNQDSLLREAVGAKVKTLTTNTRLASSASQPGGTDLLRRAATPSIMKTPIAPLLHRTMSERSNFLQPGAVKVGGTAAARTQSSAPGGCAFRRAASASSVVMGTPDRPKGMAARTARRVLVEASPPLRRPSGAGASAPRLLQPKSLRPGGNPPPLFR